MKTKIIYISGTEIFDMAEIRAAFEEVRTTLNLDKDTVLFGVPVDKDDAELTSKPTTEIREEPATEPIVEITSEETQITEEPIKEEIIPETQPKKRGRPRKQIIEDEDEEIIEEEEPTVDEEKIIPILSVLSNDEEEEIPQTIEDSVEEVEEEIEQDDSTENEEIITEETDNEIVDEEMGNLDEGVEIEEEVEPDLEKLLSEMTPLGEDLSTDIKQEKEEIEEPENVDATLEQLATEYVQNQDKIETKPSSRGKFGSFRNILPFKPKSQKDTSSGDLFSWGGLAANDEEFSVPGFFTKK